MKKTLILTLVVALAVLGAVFGAKYLSIRKAVAARGQMSMPPVTVAAATPLRQAWNTTLTAVASLESKLGVVVKTEVEGLVRRVAFTSGAGVSAGTLLVELDTSREEAQLKGLLAATRLAELSLQRTRELRQNQTNSPADLDAAEAAHAQAAASVEQVRVAITKKNIVAPFAGRLGITQVMPGQYLRAGDALVQLEALDPIYADFGLPQQAVAVARPGLAVQLTVDAFGRRAFPGTIEAINPRISDDTRNLRLRAVLANPDGTLRPGMFGRVEVHLPESREVLVLPATSIVHNPYGDSVFVIENGTAKQKIVQTGAMRGDLIAITGGIQATEQVVIAGQLKLRNGVPVRVDNTVAPDANPAPTPPES